MTTRSPAEGLYSLSAHQIALHLDDHGVSVIHNAVAPTWVDKMQSFVTDLVARDGTGTDIYLDYADTDTSGPAHQLVCDPAVGQLFHDVVRSRRPAIASEHDLVLRSSMLIRAGGTHTTPSHLFHYDPCVLTMIVPIVIPDAAFGSGGDLVAAVNDRPFRRHRSTHLIDKVAKHNTVHRRAFAQRVQRHPEQFHIPLIPGQAVMFWGYRTYHGNLTCAPGLVRATLILKYGQAHPTSSRIEKLTWRLSPSYRQLRNLERRKA